LFDAFSQKQDVIHLLDQSMKAEGVQIFIGEESGYQAFDHCSLVTSSYSVNDEVVGVLASSDRHVWLMRKSFVCRCYGKIVGRGLESKNNDP